VSGRCALVGGGYGGAAIAKALDQDTDVVLIEPKDAFVRAAGALRALVQPDWAANMFFSYDRLLGRGKVMREHAALVDPGGVTPASGARVNADHLVLASGSDYPFPAKMDTDVSAQALEWIRATHAELAGAERVSVPGRAAWNCPAGSRRFGRTST
jgi:apoptosis-inducing factor 2